MCTSLFKPPIKKGAQGPFFMCARCLGNPVGLSTHLRSGMAVVRSTGTAVTLFCGEPSMSLSE